MLNKIHNNVQSMIAEVRQIVNSHHENKNNPSSLDIEFYIHQKQPIPPFQSAKRIGNQMIKRVKTRSITQSQNHSENFQKRQKTINTDSRGQVGRLFVQSFNRNSNIKLDPNQSELLSTRIFGFNKPKYLKKEIRNELPKIHSQKNRKQKIKMECIISQDGFGIDFGEEIEHIKHTNPNIRTIDPTDQAILLRKKRRFSSIKTLISEARTKQIPSKCHIKQGNDLQPWKIDIDDPEDMNK